MAYTWSRASVEDTYRKWAPVYDKVFGAVFDVARRTAVGEAARTGGRVLEVGVGTGLSLPLYPASCRIVGIDISEPMLAVARRRVKDESLANVESLLVMDAQHLDFPDAAFDVIMAQYVVNTVPDPEAVLDELLRVLRPGGELLIVNRIGADGGARLKVERMLQPVVQRLGWRSEFPWERFERWAERAGNVTLAGRRPVPPFGHFAVIRFVKTGAARPSIGADYGNPSIASSQGHGKASGMRA